MVALAVIACQEQIGNRFAEVNVPLDPIDIPPEALEPKPWWPERPSASEIHRLAHEIKAFVQQTGAPYRWRGHTHTTPPRRASVEYWGEFDIPRSFTVEAPCPCCTPYHPKYRHHGKIAYFPEEGVIRLIGPDCFASLNPEGHEEAVEALRERQRRERDSQYLLNNLPIVPQAIRVVSAAVPIARAVDTFHKSLMFRLAKTLNINLWQQVRGGQLFVEIVRREIYATRDGQERIRLINDLQLHANLEGYRMLDPKLRGFEPRLTSVVEALESINFPDHAGALERMTDEERTEVAKKLGRSMDKGRRAFEELEDVRRLAGPTAVSTLREWGKRDGCPVRIFFDRNGDNFYVGSRHDSKLRIEISVVMEETLGALPHLGETSL